MENKEKNTQESVNSQANKNSFAAWWKKLATAAKAGIIAGAAVVVILPIVLIIALGGNSNDAGDETNDTNPPVTDETVEKVRYTVTVVDQYGNLVDGVSVEFVADTSLTWKTKSGVAEYNTTKEITAAIITKIPAGYSYDNLGKELYFDSTANIKITLTSNKSPVSVKIVDQDGNAVAGVTVQVCETGEGGSCVGLGETDENGVATKVIKNADYKAQITILPEGYTVEDISAYYPLENGEVTIVVTKDAE